MAFVDFNLLLNVGKRIGHVVTVGSAVGACLTRKLITYTGEREELFCAAEALLLRSHGGGGWSELHGH